MTELASNMRGGRWLALFLLLVGVGLPDCCLNGSHAFGAGMDFYSAICHSKG